MIHFDEHLLECLSRISPQKWEGDVYRHMFANFPPDQENTSGARWNSPEVPAIYTSLSREVVIAEADYQISMQPRRPRARRTIYKIGVCLANVLDISSGDTLRVLGLEELPSEVMDLRQCQLVGSSAERLGHDGILVPSARAAGLNLVIYPNRTTASSYQFDVIDAEVIDAGMRW